MEEDKELENESGNTNENTNENTNDENEDNETEPELGDIITIFGGRFDGTKGKIYYHD